MQPVLTIFCVTLAVAVLAVLARRVGTASSILLLVAGVALSFVPGVPAVRIEPEVVLLLLLPPLLYSSGVAMSWRDFRADLRPILLLAVGCVLFTALGVAAIAHWVLGLSWPVGFVLGAVVSPPDAVAPMAILHRLGLPRRILTVLNGESLVNDATALVLLSFALTAVVTGGVSPVAALGRFGAIVGGEIGWGLLVGWAMLRARHLARDPRAEVVLALATPFIAFWPPHEAGGSGVIACVMSGLWVSWNGRRLIRPATRLQGFFIWGLVTWLVEGALFLLTGLQARAVMAGVALQGWSAALVAAAIVCAAVIVLRFVWVFPATYLPRLVPAVRARDPQPDWRLPFLVGFTGLRGVVSLAAALSIPLQIGTEPFAERPLLLFLTFCVIASTLIGQGSTLPWVARRLGLVSAGREERQRDKRDEQRVRIEAIDAGLAEIERAGSGGAAKASVDALRRAQNDRRDHHARTADVETDDDPVADATDLLLRVLGAERASVNLAYDRNGITDEARRRIEREFDLEEARAHHTALSAGRTLDPDAED